MAGHHIAPVAVPRVVLKHKRWLNKRIGLPSNALIYSKLSGGLVVIACAHDDLKGLVIIKKLTEGR